jgi:hypothetical protein
LSDNKPALQDLVEVRRLFRLPDEALVEKDWFVVKALAAIGAADKGPFQLILQGGTALSRAHRLRAHVGRHRYQNRIRRAAAASGTAAPSRTDRGRASQSWIQIRSQESETSKIEL